VKELVDRLLSRWKAAGVAWNLGATEAAITAFERQHGVHLPNDLRTFLGLVNGIPFSELDGLARLRPVEEFFPLPDAPGYYCFADYNIEGSLWAVHLSNDPAPDNPVRVVWYGGDGREEARSFTAFLSRYLAEGPDAMC
jgi:hypothetical protein